MLPKTELDRAEIMDWRNDERAALVARFAAALPVIYAKTDAIIEEMGLSDAVNRSSFHDANIAPVVEQWLTELNEDFNYTIQESTESAERALGVLPVDHAWSWPEIAGTGAVTALSLAPLAALPMVASAVTVTATSFLVFSTSVISIPLLTVAIGGMALAGYGGHSARKYATDWFLEGYGEKVRNEIRDRAVGNPDDLAAPSLCRHLLIEIDQIANLRLDARQ